MLLGSKASAMAGRDVASGSLPERNLPSRLPPRVVCKGRLHLPHCEAADLTTGMTIVEPVHGWRTSSQQRWGVDRTAMD